MTLALPTVYLLGVLSALDALMKSRTAQGATAWGLALISMPLVALPLYWVFGRTKFEDYIDTLRSFDRQLSGHLESRRRQVLAVQLIQPDEEVSRRTQGELRAFQALATHPFTRGNELKLLVDGDAMFEALFAGIDSARDYILVQFYIINDDDIGRQFQQRLIAAARRGVRVRLLYDEIGSYSLPQAYLNQLQQAGVDASGFSGSRSRLGRFRLNFRNHRKILIVDGRLGFMGGLNVGDEYLGRDPKLSPWRDTHLQLEGPAVLGLQYSFLRDWYYSCQQIPEVDWRLHTARDDGQKVLVLASGPADDLETCGLLFTHAIESAEQRVWIASPYFVPDGRVLGALQLAALRGVDTRVIMPRSSDNLLFRYIPYAYLEEAEQAGVKFYLFEPGFMHQKVMVIDRDYASIGSANLDNRSFRLNFEVTCLVNDQRFCDEVAKMLERDLTRSTRLTRDVLAGRSWWFRLATQLTRLLAPVL